LMSEIEAVGVDIVANVLNQKCTEIGT
jgi:hypothetical protein